MDYFKRRLAFHGHLVIRRLHGTRPRGRPRTTWLKYLATQANINYKEAITIPRDRKKWMSSGNPRRTPDEELLYLLITRPWINCIPSIVVNANEVVTKSTKQLKKLYNHVIKYYLSFRREHPKVSNQAWPATCCKTRIDLHKFNHVGVPCYPIEYVNSLPLYWPKPASAVSPWTGRKRLLRSPLELAETGRPHRAIS